MDESVLPLKEEIKLLSSQHPTTPSEKVSVRKKRWIHDEKLAANTG